MPRNHKRINVEWKTHDCDGNIPLDVATLEVLMDIRSELRMLNTTLGCYRVRRMSDDINRIDKRLKNAGLLAIKRKK